VENLRALEDYHHSKGHGELVGIMALLRDMRVVPRADGSAVLADTVCHDSGSPITKKRFELAWTETRKAAKLPHRLFHDFRRAAARRLTNAGVPQVVAMRVTGHKTPSMFRRYSIVETVDMAKGLERVARREEPRRFIGSGDGHRSAFFPRKVGRDAGIRKTALFKTAQQLTSSGASRGAKDGSRRHPPPC
jgi:integrase